MWLECKTVKHKWRTCTIYKRYQICAQNLLHRWTVTVSMISQSRLHQTWISCFHASVQEDTHGSHVPASSPISNSQPSWDVVSWWIITANKPTMIINQVLLEYAVYCCMFVVSNSYHVYFPMSVMFNYWICCVDVESLHWTLSLILHSLMNHPMNCFRR